MHIIQTCNEEKEVLEDQFGSVKANIEILGTRIRTDKHCVDADVAAVGTQLQVQEAVLQAIRSGINILQEQDAQIVQEANDMFITHKREMEAMNKHIMDNPSQILAIKGTNIGIQRSLKDMNSKIQKVNEVLDSIKTSLREVPSRRELKEHPTAMGEQIVQMQEVNTGLTTAMEGYKFSESSQYNFRQQVPQAGPSTTVHPERRRYFGSDASSLRDTANEVTWLGGLRGGVGSNTGAEDGAAAGAAGGAASGVAGGAAGGVGDPPHPGSRPPSDHGNNNHPRLSRRQKRIWDLQYAKPIEIKEPNRFEGRPGDDFDTY